MTASDLDSLEHDLPTTEADIEALRSARRGSAMSAAEVQQLLERLGPMSAPDLRARPGRGDEPFRLRR